MKSKIRKNIISAIISAFVFINFYAINDAKAIYPIDDDEASEYAEFILSISQNIKGQKKGSFCIYGNDDITKVLVNSNPDIIEIDGHWKNIKTCSIAYIAITKKKWFKVEGSIFMENKIATIAIYNNFSLNDNASIEVQIGRRSFELLVNKKNLKANGIKLSPLITNLVIN